MRILERIQRVNCRCATLLACIALLLGLLAVSPRLALADEGTCQLAAGEVVDGNRLDGVTVRFRPHGSHKPLAIKHNGADTQNCAHLYYLGRSSRFYLESADEDSYYIYFYEDFNQAKHKNSGDCRLDIDDDGGYDREGNVVHVAEGNKDAMSKRWQIVSAGDGTYYIRNKRSGQYWSLDDLSKPKTNGNKLVQRKKALEWDIEIVNEGEKQSLSDIKGYDSLNFTYDGEEVTSLNWMSRLPDELPITELSIPGTHDAGTCNMGSATSKQDQQYHIDDLLRAGVRHLDVRTGGGDGSNPIIIIHSKDDAYNREGKNLTLDEVMGWVNSFLDENKQETVVLQLKEDLDDKVYENWRGVATAEYFRDRASKPGSKIWVGDHVPTLGEVRGKIVIMSRLYVDPVRFDVTDPKTGKAGKWAINAHTWKESAPYAIARDGSGDTINSLDRAVTDGKYGCEVWTQDDWKHNGSDKKPFIQNSLLGVNAHATDLRTCYPDGTFGTEYRRSEALSKGRFAWIFNYASCSHGKDTPFNNAKEVHQWLYDRSYLYHEGAGVDEKGNDTGAWLLPADIRTGVMAFDFADELIASTVYRTNFNRIYVTVHAVAADGSEPVKPIKLSVKKGTAYEDVIDEAEAIYFNRFQTNDSELIVANDGRLVYTLDRLSAYADERAFLDARVPYTDMVMDDTDIFLGLRPMGKKTDSKNEVPAGEALANETPADEAPASEVPASEAPASDVPANEAPASEVPAGVAPADGVAQQEPIEL